MLTCPFVGLYLPLSLLMTRLNFTSNPYAAGRCLMDRKRRTFDAGSCKALANLAVVAGRDLERACVDRPWSAALSKVPQRTDWRSKTMPSAIMVCKRLWQEGSRGYPLPQYMRMHPEGPALAFACFLLGWEGHTQGRCELLHLGLHCCYSPMYRSHGERIGGCRCDKSV